MGSRPLDESLRFSTVGADGGLSGSRSRAGVPLFTTRMSFPAVRREVAFLFYSGSHQVGRLGPSACRGWCALLRPPTPILLSPGNTLADTRRRPHRHSGTPSHTQKHTDTRERPHGHPKVMFNQLIWGNSNPLQCSCLENPKDRGAWRATVHGVATVGHDWVTKPWTSRRAVKLLS